MAGPSPIVLISPAMAIGSRYYRPLVEAFEARGWDAWALTRRGFEAGERRAARDHDWSYRDEIDDIADAVATARHERPERPVVLLGHSLGGQLAVGHQLNRPPADALVTVATSLPYHRDFPWGGVHLVAMGALVVPALTTAFGYLPPPAFGAPGARTLMREWARMVLTGRPSFPVTGPVATPSLLVSLEADHNAPRGAVDAFARRVFAAGSVIREHLRSDGGAAVDHVAWVRSPDRVVDRVVAWWDTAGG